MTTSTCYWIYILECKNGAYYTGYTRNLARRFRQHVDGTSKAKYTRTYRPVKIAQCWQLRGAVGAALRVERLIKAGGRKLKERLIVDPSRLRDLANRRLGETFEITDFDPETAERAARAMTTEDLRRGVDPLSGQSHALSVARDASQ